MEQQEAVVDPGPSRFPEYEESERLELKTPEYEEYEYYLSNYDYEPVSDPQVDDGLPRLLPSPGLIDTDVRSRGLTVERGKVKMHANFVHLIGKNLSKVFKERVLSIRAAVSAI